MRGRQTRVSFAAPSSILEETPLNLRFVAIGLFSGLLSALFGVGGGIVTVPALTLLLRFPIKTAIGTSLLAMVPVAVAGVVTECFVRPENLQVEMGVWLAAGAAIGTLGGRWILGKLGEGGLRWVYAFFLLFVAMRLSGVFAISLLPAIAWDEAYFLGIAVILATGGLAGASSTLFGVGGGVVAVPLLVLLIQGTAFHEARATSLLMIPAAAAFGVWHHAKMGNLDFAAAWKIAVPACLGAIAGIFLVQTIPGRDLQSLFAVLLVFAAWRMLRQKRPLPERVSS